jgi:hypothetical protein
VCFYVPETSIEKKPGKKCNMASSSQASVSSTVSYLEDLEGDLTVTLWEVAEEGHAYVMGLHGEAKTFLRNHYINGDSVGHPFQKPCPDMFVSRKMVAGLNLLGEEALFEITRYYIRYGGCPVCSVIGLSAVFDHCSLGLKRYWLTPQMWRDFDSLR